MPGTPRLVALEFISVDGVIEAPHEWHFPYFTPELGEVLDQASAGMDALLLGRKTYEAFAESWPARGGEDGGENGGEDGGKEMNGAHHYVVSNTLTEGSWDPTTVIAGSRAEIAAGIRRVKAQDGGRIVTWGSAQLVRFMLREGLLDELHLLLHPVVLGAGQRLWEDAGRIPLQVVESRTLPGGTVHVAYARGEDPEGHAIPAE